MLNFLLGVLTATGLLSILGLNLGMSVIASGLAAFTLGYFGAAGFEFLTSKLGKK